MLNWIINGKGVFRRFLFPDTGEGSGGGRGEHQSGGSSNGGGSAAIEDPFAGIPFDELDTKTREALQTAQTSFKERIATLQKVPELETQLAKLTAESRDYQSQKDRLEAQLRALVTGPNPPAAGDEYLDAAKKVLKDSGFTEEQVNKQAPIYASLLKSQLNVLKKDIGKDLGPLASSVITAETSDAFQHAVDQDAMGYMAIPEVAQEVWTKMQERAKTGAPSTAELALNLGKIVYMDLVSKLQSEKKDIPALVPRSGSGGGGMTQFTYPGANRGNATFPIVNAPNDGKQAKTQLNPDTEAALAATFATMGRSEGVYPKQYAPKK